MQASVQIDSTQFVSAVRSLAQISGKTFRDVLRSEAASVVKLAAKWERMASAAKIRQTVERQKAFRRGDYKVLLTGKAVWVLDRRTGKKYPVFAEGREMRLPDEVWAEYNGIIGARSQLKKESLRKRLAARGLSRQSWVQIADALGIDIESVAPGGSVQAAAARKAVSKKGRSYLNGKAAEEAVQDSLVLTLVNESPLVASRGGQALLQRALNARANAFFTSLDKGVFDDIAARAKRYPGLFTSKS